MEAEIQKFLVEYLRRTKRFKTVEFLREELVREGKIKLSFSIRSAPKRNQAETIYKKPSLRSKKSNALHKKRMNYF